MTKEKLYMYIKILSIIGVMLSLYLLWQQVFHPSFKPCNINSTINCEAIVNGPVAKTLGIPTPLIGLIGYVVIFFATDFKKMKLALGMAIFGLVFCLRIAIIEIFQLKVLCPVCIACQVDMLALVVLIWMSLKKDGSKTTPKKGKIVKTKIDLSILKNIRVEELLLTWLPMVTIITLFGCILYVVEQQHIRLSANEQIVEISQNTVDLLNSGNQPPEGLSASATDVTRSISPFIVVFNEEGNPIYSSGSLNGNMPTLNQNVFQANKILGDVSRFTWQPAKGLRFAAILQKYNGEKPGYLLVAKSLRENDRLTQILGYEIVTGIVLASIVTLLLMIYLELTYKRAKILKS